jgi:hypothetical protein
MWPSRVANDSYWFTGLLLRLLQVVAGLLIGFFFHRIFIESGFVGAAWQLMAEAARSIYESVGIVSVGLVALTLYLIGLSVFILLEYLELWLFRSNPRDKLRLVQELGPMLGVTGTMISLSQAMGSLTMSKGVEVAINHMSSLVAQALGSSIWGVTLAMVAFLLKFFCPRDDKVKT